MEGLIDVDLHDVAVERALGFAVLREVLAYVALEAFFLDFLLALNCVICLLLLIVFGLDLAEFRAQCAHLLNLGRQLVLLFLALRVDLLD